MVEISIIIPFKNAAVTLSDCLQSILSQKYPSFEVILIDNNSDDESFKIAHNFVSQYKQKVKIKLIKEAKPGASAARNAGTRISSGRFLAFTDADCILEPFWLERLMDGFNDDCIAAMAGKVQGYPPEGIVDAFHGLFTLQSADEVKTFRDFTLISGGFPTANLIVRKKIFEEIGGFDESIILYGEDYDLCARIYSQGYRIKYQPAGIIYHRNRRDIKSTIKQSFHFGRSHCLLLNKHYRRHALFEIGGFKLRSSRLPLKLWIDVSSADKKMACLLAIACLFPYLLVLVPIYNLYLLHLIWNQAKKREFNVNPGALAVMSGLLLIKSVSITTGRLWGSIEHKVICF